MITKIALSEEYLGVLDDNKPLQIFIGMIVLPISVIFDCILLPLEVIALVISKILEGSDKE